MTGLAPSPAKYAALLDRPRVQAFREAQAAVEAAEQRRAEHHRLVALARSRRLKERSAATTRRARTIRVVEDEILRSRRIRAVEDELAAIRLDMAVPPRDRKFEATLAAADRVRRAALAAHPDWTVAGPSRLAAATAEAAAVRGRS